MKYIRKVDAVKLARGLKEILREMYDDGLTGGFPIARFEEMIVEKYGVDLADAEGVTEAVINTGIVAWSMGSNHFVLSGVDHD